MAYTQTDLDNIQRAIASGTESAVLEGRSIRFRSLDEMQQIELKIKESLDAATNPATTKTRRVIRPVFL